MGLVTGQHKVKEVYEIDNYADVLLQARKIVEPCNISLPMLLDLHRILRWKVEPDAGIYLSVF